MKRRGSWARSPSGIIMLGDTRTGGREPCGRGLTQKQNYRSFLLLPPNAIVPRFALVFSGLELS
jgi:hypothetical protein